MLLSAGRHTKRIQAERNKSGCSKAMLQPHAYNPTWSEQHGNHWQHIRHDLVVGHSDNIPRHDLLRLVQGAGWPYIFATGLGITTRA